jgi:hypothetical protein
MPPRPFIFVDERWDVCRGFQSSVGKRSWIFRPCWVERRGDDYTIIGAESGDHAIPHDTFAGYLDAWNPNIP